MTLNRRINGSKNPNKRTSVVNITFENREYKEFIKQEKKRIMLNKCLGSLIAIIFIILVFSK